MLSLSWVFGPADRFAQLLKGESPISDRATRSEKAQEGKRAYSASGLRRSVVVGWFVFTQVYRLAGGSGGKNFFFRAAFRFFLPRSLRR